MTLAAIVDDVELRLADFYAFAPRSRAAGHLVTREQLRASLGDGVAELPEYQGRAGVFLVEAPPAGAADELFIGIYLDEPVRATLETLDPTAALTDRNLDAYCVLIEEVSHFHLILNRAGRAQGVSKLELEWQGEIDKLLVCAFTLERQAGDPHLLPLARRLFDGAAITSADHELYWQATRHAARFWFDAMRRDAHVGPDMRRLLRQAYHQSWAEKLVQLREAG